MKGRSGGVHLFDYAGDLPQGSATGLPGQLLRDVVIPASHSFHFHRGTHAQRVCDNVGFFRHVDVEEEDPISGPWPGIALEGSGLIERKDNSLHRVFKDRGGRARDVAYDRAP